MAMTETGRKWRRTWFAAGTSAAMLMLAACSNIDIGNWPGDPDPVNPANRPSTMNPALQQRMFEPGGAGYARYDYGR
ncbi:MAG: hypothetical protein ABWY00_15165 [Dongiaceae bacterium]